jgi:predicted DCC family thiol-disulfide oxidoreductase YuxK
MSDRRVSSLYTEKLSEIDRAIDDAIAGKKLPGAVLWIEHRQEKNARTERAKLLYDGHCGFCLDAVAKLKVMDYFRWLEPVDFRPLSEEDLRTRHPELTLVRCQSELVLVEAGRKLSGGFNALRRMSQHLPMLIPLLPALYLPGAGWIGRPLYRFVAQRRFLLHRSRRCQENHCHR